MTGTGAPDAAGETPAAGPTRAALGPLRAALARAAEEFADGPDALAGILTGMVDDVDRALGEPLEIFPVAHHSPAAALAMVRRLREKRPAVIYLELCEDLAPLLAELGNCRLPVALQAFASDTEDHPPEWAPLSVIAPITEASAEYQAIAYARGTPGVDLVLVDRSADHVFQWLPRDVFQWLPRDGEGESGAEEDGTGHAGDSPSENGDGAALHGDAIGIEIGDLRPGFPELEAYLLHHGKVRHWSEWWDQYVEQPLTGADHLTYRQVMVLIGSLFRRLRPHDRDRLDRDEDRERYMWTRIREHLATTGTDPDRALFVCGAFHAASRVDQFGLHPADPTFEITPRTATRWRYGLIPSSHSAVEAQFGLAPGSVSIAAATWKKALTRHHLTPFALDGQAGKPSRRRSAKAAATAAAVPPATDAPPDRLSAFLAEPPVPDALDETELLGWCVDIVRLARRHRYQASTADAIAVYETSILLAGMRGRARPTPYDFADAAVTCIEKDTVPGRRSVAQLCGTLLGGDRIGQVGYGSLPPLARDVLDRLAVLGINLQARTIQRALVDLTSSPELEPASDLLWQLRLLLPPEAIRPVMGERRLGARSTQESWDLAIGRHQRQLIELGYEGVTVEQVLEQRLRRRAWADSATPADALTAVEDALLFLANPRLVEELGNRAVALLAHERTADTAPEVLRRFRRLLAHYRVTQPQPPAWCDAFAATGYAHYCTLLPAAFADEETGLGQVAAMLGFLSSMENLAVALGSDPTQLRLAVGQSHPRTPAKTALLWAVQVRLDLLTTGELRSRCADLLTNPLVLPSFPEYVSGLAQALDPVPSLAPFVVELLSTAFAELPDSTLLPWLPTLLTTLRAQAPEAMPALVREAARIFPSSLPALDAFVPPWVAEATGPPAQEGRDGARAPSAQPGATDGAAPIADLLAAHPDTCDAVGALLG